MPKKTYILPALNGGEVLKTLALQTNRNVASILRILGLKSFHDLYGQGDMVKAATIRMDIGVDREKFKDVLNVIFVEGSDGIDIDNVDLTITDGAVQDFFEQRSKSLGDRLGS